jgi:hypothetical protein
MVYYAKKFNLFRVLSILFLEISLEIKFLFIKIFCNRPLNPYNIHLNTSHMNEVWWTEHMSVICFFIWDALVDRSNSNFQAENVQ